MAAPKIKLRKAAGLKPSPNNARTHSPEQLGQIEASLIEFGFTSPLLVDEEGIVAGHGRHEAALAIYARGERLRFPDKSEIPNGQIPTIDVTGWNPDQRRAYMLADNQIAAQAGWDEELLKAELDALTELGVNLDALGFDEGALQELLGQIEAATPRTPGGGGEDSDFQHIDRYGVIVECKNEAEQEAVFTRLRDEGLSVKVVVV